MGWLWRIIGLIIGGKYFSVQGAFLGFLIGYILDTRVMASGPKLSPSQKAEIEAEFFSSLFTLLGYLAKVDGRIDEDEVQYTERLMRTLTLSAEHKRDAIHLFKLGAKADFSWQARLNAFMAVCESREMLINYLVAFVYQDATPHEAQRSALVAIVAYLGFDEAYLRQLLSRQQGQSYFHKKSTPPLEQPKSPLDMAYAALGAQADESDAAIKKRYRKLMSQYHPDMLAGAGVSADLIALATQQSQEIQAAYDLIKKSRNS
jgi:DnaJ like chaperone protein